MNSDLTWNCKYPRPLAFSINSEVIGDLERDTLTFTRWLVAVDFIKELSSTCIEEFMSVPFFNAKRFFLRGPDALEL